MFGLRAPELIIILVVVLIIFGPKNLPKLGKSLGSTVKNIREGMEGDDKAETKQAEEVVVEQSEEDKEIDRILRILSGECAAQRETILYNYDVLVQLDAIFARAQLSYAMDAGRPMVRKRGGIALKRARPPLLDQAKAVPVTVELGGRFDTLVITGPNTGGKTVTLKTIGLLSLMAQCGLHIPAGDQSAVQVFSRILADVGDEQSIEQSLSTFSAHMANSVVIL